MHQVCPDCGSKRAVNFIAEVGQNVCSDCGTVSQELQLYEPKYFYEVAFALGAPKPHRSSSTNLHSFWAITLEDSRRRAECIRKPEVDARIQGTLNTLGYPGLFEQVDFLFQRARHMSWQYADTQSKKEKDALNSATLSASDLPSTSPVVRRVRWGSDSLFLATACCYAVLRREAVPVDLQTVSNAAQIEYPKVKRAFRRLRLLVNDALRNVKLANPDVYIRRIIAFFLVRLELSSSSPSLTPKVVKFLRPLSSRTPAASSSSSTHLAPALSNTPLEAIAATAIDLCKFWWPKGERCSGDPQLAAFAVVILALEAHLRVPAPVYEIFRYTRQALQFDHTRLLPNTDDGPGDSGDEPFSKHTIAHYTQLCSVLRREASRIPWLTDIKSIPNRTRHKGNLFPPVTELDQHGVTDLVRRDLIIHALDILDVWKATTSTASNDESSPAGAVEALSINQPEAYDRRSEDEAPTPSGEVDEDASGNEMNDDELDCFVAANLNDAHSGQYGNIKDEENDDSLHASDRESAIGAEYEEVWPRIQAKLKGQGISSSLAGRRDEEAKVHPIDLLSDEQVDTLLFSADELNSIFRADPAELAAFERVKIAAGNWPAVSVEAHNADFVACATSKAHSDAKGHRRRVKAKGQASLTHRPTSSTGTKRQKTQHRKEQPVSAAGPHAGHASLSKPHKRERSTLPKVSLRHQQEESDWSD